MRGSDVRNLPHQNNIIAANRVIITMTFQLGVICLSLLSKNQQLVCKFHKVVKAEWLVLTG